MKTERIYQHDPYQKEASAKVLSIDRDGDTLHIVPDRTVFFPTAGGQPCDMGTITFGDTLIKVADVFEDGDALIHVADILHEEQAICPDPGREITLTIDWDRRFDNMQRHTGEHILSGAFHRLYGGANKGFHMGADYITIDILLPEGGPSFVDWKMAMEAEEEACRVITRDLPVTVTYFSSGEEARSFPLRKELAIEEDVSVVTVGDVDNPADCVACCGTHTATSGQIGLIKIYKVEPNKGMTRIYFEAGGRAMANYRRQFDIMYDMGSRLSTGIYDLPGKLDSMQKDMDKLYEDLKAFRNRVTTQEAAEINASLADEKVPVLVKRYNDLSVDDLLALSKKLEIPSPPADHSTAEDSGGRANHADAPASDNSDSGAASTDRTVNIGEPASDKLDYSGASGGQVNHSGPLVCLVHSPDNTVLLFSNGTPDCGAFVKEYAHPLGGKGGGKQVSARAMFPNKDGLEKFLLLLK